MDPKQPNSKCMRCGKRPPETAFAKRRDTNRYDSLCIKCRFAVIDAKHSEIEDIRDDMEQAGIPVHSRSSRKP